MTSVWGSFLVFMCLALPPAISAARAETKDDTVSSSLNKMCIDASAQWVVNNYQPPRLGCENCWKLTKKEVCELDPEKFVDIATKAIVVYECKGVADKFETIGDALPLLTEMLNNVCETWGELEAKPETTVDKPSDEEVCIDESAAWIVRNYKPPRRGCDDCWHVTNEEFCKMEVKSIASTIGKAGIGRKQCKTVQASFKYLDDALPFLAEVRDKVCAKWQVGTWKPEAPVDTRTAKEICMDESVMWVDKNYKPPTRECLNCWKLTKEEVCKTDPKSLARVGAQAMEDSKTCDAIKAEFKSIEDRLLFFTEMRDTVCKKWKVGLWKPEAPVETTSDMEECLDDSAAWIDSNYDPPHEGCVNCWKVTKEEFCELDSEKLNDVADQAGRGNAKCTAFRTKLEKPDNYLLFLTALRDKVCEKWVKGH